VTSTVSPAAPVDGGAACANCGAARVGPYCHACGQASPEAPRSFGEVFTGQTGKVVHTVRNLLLHPGELAREIDEGRDRRSMRPLTLLLNLVAFFFIVGSGYTGGFNTRTFLSTGIDQVVPALRSMPGAPDSAERAHYEERLEHRFQSVYSLLVIVQTLAYGAAIGFAERSKRKAWIVHFAAATQYMCFSVLVAIVAFGLGRLAGIETSRALGIGIVMYAIVTVYMTMTVRRVYGDIVPLAIAKTLGIMLFAYIVSNILSFAALIVAVVTT
jgi:hypothetical protein